MKPQPIVSILTDFGTRDWYVGVMKGVILQGDATTSVIDITHDIPPGNIHAGAFALEQSWPWFPKGTVFLCVVDPGVGTSRKPIAVAAQERYFVGPDNGLFTPLYRFPHEVRSLDHASLHGHTQSHTFHGRDIFAPSAAALAHGLPFNSVGAWIQDPVTLEPPALDSPQVMVVDHFGNAITNLPAGAILFTPDPSVPRFRVGDREVPLIRTYGDIDPGSAAALVGSTGYLEFVVNQGNASEALQLGPGDTFSMIRD